MTIDTEDEALAASRRQQLLDLTDQEFRLWQHHPLTAAFLQFMGDQVAAWREVAADLVENGMFRQHAQQELQNPDVVRGQIIAVRNLQGITLAHIHEFYGKEIPEAEEPARSQDDQE